MLALGFGLSVIRENSIAHLRVNITVKWRFLLFQRLSLPSRSMHDLQAQTGHRIRFLILSDFVCLWGELPSVLDRWRAQPREYRTLQVETICFVADLLVREQKLTCG